MVEKKVPMTPEGFRKLQQDLKHLKSVERPQVMQAIEEARGHGDLTENAEYDAAKERQQQLEMRIREIEDKLARAQVISTTEQGGGKVVFGATVVLTDLTSSRKMTYRLVGEDEANFSLGKISVHSPLAREMIGKEVGEVFLVQTPGGEKEYSIDEIRFE